MLAKDFLQRTNWKEHMIAAGHASGLVWGLEVLGVSFGRLWDVEFNMCVHIHL